MSFKEDLEKKIEEYNYELQQAKLTGNQDKINKILEEIKYLEDARHSVA